MTVSELIKALQEIPDQAAVVTIDDTATGGELPDASAVVFTAGSGTFPLDAPEAEYGAGDGSTAYAAGTVVLTSA